MILHLNCNGPLDDLVHKLKLEMGRKFEYSWKSSDSFLSLSLNYTDKEIWFFMIPVAFKKFSINQIEVQDRFKKRVEGVDFFRRSLVFSFVVGLDVFLL